MTTRMPPLVAMLTHSAACSGAELFIARVAAARVRVDVVVVLGEHGPLEAVLDQLGVDHEDLGEGLREWLPEFVKTLER